MSPGLLPTVASGLRGGYNPKTVDGDGVNDYYSLSGNVTGMTNTKAGTIIAFVDSASSGRLILNAGARFSVRINGQFNVEGRTSSNVKILNIRGLTNISGGALGPMLLSASWDLAVPKTHLLINGKNDEKTADTLEDDGAIHYDRGSWGMFATTTGASVLTGRFGFVWFDPVYHDLSSASALDDIWNNGRTKDPGADGSNYFGAQPLMFFDRRNGVSNWSTDKGTAGDTWTENGALADGGRIIQ